MSYTRQLAGHVHHIYGSQSIQELHPSIHPLYFVWRIQRRLWGALEARQHKRRLAFVMGLQALLGECIGLHADSLRLILEGL